MGDDRDDEDLDERVADLEARVRELQADLGRPPTVFGLARPPTPREVLSFTGEYAIPTAIAVLEANVRALEALQGVIRLLDTDGSATAESRDRLEARAADASRATLDRLETALESVERTIQEGGLPREDEARDILDDARQLNREIRDRVERERWERVERERWKRDERERRERENEPHARERTADDGDEDARGTTIELEDDEPDNDEPDNDETEADVDADADDTGPDIDVEAELRSIKDQLDDGRSGDDAGTGTDEDADSP